MVILLSLVLECVVIVDSKQILGTEMSIVAAAVGTTKTGTPVDVTVDAFLHRCEKAEALRVGARELVLRIQGWRRKNKHTHTHTLHTTNVMTSQTHTHEIVARDDAQLCKAVDSVGGLPSSRHTHIHTYTPVWGALKRSK